MKDASWKVKGRWVGVDLLSKVFTGWRLIFENIYQGLDMSRLFFLVPLTAASVLFVYSIISKGRYIYRKLRFTVEKNKKTILRRLSQKLMVYSPIKALLTGTAIKVGMYTEFSFEKNIEIACAIIFACAGLVLSVVFIIMPRVNVVWYMFLAYMCLTGLFMMLILYVLNTVVRARFTSKLPETFKLLNSRYISKENILKAIHISLYEYDDFDRTVKKVMRLVNDVLYKNNMKEIDETFKLIESTYGNEYLTLMLNLIRQAHYNGGKKVIKEQFEHATEDILIEIENQKDLSATSRSYILLAAFMPFGMAGIERFNCFALQEKSVEFYKSIPGIEWKIIFFGVLSLYIGYMLLLERTA